MRDYIIVTDLSKLKAAARAYQARQLAREGLAMANRGNPFWTKRDAMQTINLTAKHAYALGVR